MNERERERVKEKERKRVSEREYFVSQTSSNMITNIKVVVS